MVVLPCPKWKNTQSSGGWTESLLVSLGSMFDVVIAKNSESSAYLIYYNK